MSYFCTCTRCLFRQCENIHDGRCHHLNHGRRDAAKGLKINNLVLRFHDKRRGFITSSPEQAQEEFMIHRQDGLFAYNLKTVADDHH